MASGIDPPYRLDPFQNIVNVSWKSTEFVLVVGFCNSPVPGGSGEGIAEVAWLRPGGASGHPTLTGPLRPFDFDPSLLPFTTYRGALGQVVRFDGHSQISNEWDSSTTLTFDKSGAISPLPPPSRLRRLQIFTDSDGSKLYLEGAGLTKYDRNDVLLWTSAQSGDPVLIDAANNNNIICIQNGTNVTLNQGGGTVGSVTFGNQIYGGFEQGRVSDTTADGNTYFFIRDGDSGPTGVDHFIKYDVSGAAVWTVDIPIFRLAFGGTGNSPRTMCVLNNDFVVMIDPTPSGLYNGNTGFLFSYNLVVLKTSDGSEAVRFRWGESAQNTGGSPPGWPTTDGRPRLLSRPPRYPEFA